MIYPQTVGSTCSIEKPGSNTDSALFVTDGYMTAFGCWAVCSVLHVFDAGVVVGEVHV